jgi:hypothetical protein
VRLRKIIRTGAGMFSSHTRFEVRKGSKIRFGMACGVGTRPLKKVFQI